MKFTALVPPLLSQPRLWHPLAIPLFSPTFPYPNLTLGHRRQATTRPPEPHLHHPRESVILIVHWCSPRHPFSPPVARATRLPPASHLPCSGECASLRPRNSSPVSWAFMAWTFWAIAHLSIGLGPILFTTVNSKTHRCSPKTLFIFGKIITIYHTKTVIHTTVH